MAIDLRFVLGCFPGLSWALFKDFARARRIRPLRKDVLKSPVCRTKSAEFAKFVLILRMRSAACR